jgi:hypothetical protein
VVVIFHFLESDVANSHPKYNTDKAFLKEKKEKRLGAIKNKKRGNVDGRGGGVVAERESR